MKNFVLQIDQSDCGVACLLSLIRYYGGENNIESLRRLSGTSVTGTTLLGLKEAAEACGFDADGCEADMASLIEHAKPCVLHVTIDNLQHYVICFGTYLKGDKLVFKIGDPAKGIVYLTEREVDTLWVSKICLTLQPNDKFRYSSQINIEKRKWIFSLLKDDLPLLYIAVSMGIAISVLGLSLALFSQKLIDDILPKHETTKLYVGIGLVFFLLLLKETASYFRQYFLLRQAYGFNIRLVDFFYTHLLQLPKPFFDTRKTGELTARLNDTTRIQKVISQIAGNAVIDILIVLMTIVFVFIYAWQAGIICLVTLPVLYFIIYRFNHPIRDSQREAMSAYANAEGNYISTLQGVGTIMNYSQQHTFSELSKHIYSHYQDRTFGLGKIQIKVGLFANVFSVFFLTIILLYATNAVINGSLKTGELMAIVSMSSTLLPSTANLALLSIPINEAKVAFDRMFEFTVATREKEKHAKLSPITTIESIALMDISFRYPGRKLLFKNTTFTLRKGEVFELIGRNGSGKSTLLQILLRHYTPASGKIIVNDTIDLQEIKSTEWLTRVAEVPQQVHIFNATILENIAFEDATKNTASVLEFLKEYDFMQFIEKLPNSFMTLAGEEGINLSGGQKQIIAIARALYKKPQLLILDEATAAMDATVDVFVSQLIRRIKPHMMILVVTHKPGLIQELTDDVWLLDDCSSR